MNAYWMRKVAVALAAGTGLSLSAATYTWVPGSTDWRSLDSYMDEEGVTPVAQLPGREDTVAFEGAQTVTIEDGDMAFVSSLMCLSPRTNSVTLVFNLTEDACLNADVVNTRTSGNMGKIVKRGRGTLQLGDAVLVDNWVSNYRLNEVLVEEGTLICPTNIPSYKHLGGGTLTVNANGIFVVPTPGNFRFNKVIGTGVISNLVGRSGAAQFQPQGAGSVFGGKLSGNLSYISPAGINLTGTESTINNGFTIYALNAQRTMGTVGVMKLGESGTPSSVGKNSTITLGSGDGGACLLYLGKGEWTNRKFALAASKGEPIVIDAGAHGGLYFVGDGITMNWSGMIPLVLDGSNTVNACVISNSIACKTANGTNYTVQIVKRGTGKWRFANPENAMAGAIAVENGTLQFDSLAEKGMACALGKATELYKPAYGLAKDKVDYAYLIGSPSARGFMEYLGASAAFCIDRPVRLTGMGGGIVANGGSMRIGNFASADATGSMLILSGSNNEENLAMNVTDGKGPLSVVKDGTCTWVLERQQDFSGSLSVKQGTLIARNSQGRKYSWYRIWFKEKGSTSTKYSGLESSSYIQVLEFALKNASGVQQNICTEQKRDWRVLEPGECAPGATDGFVENSGKELIKMFDGNLSAYAQCGSTSKSYRIGDSKTWFPVVLRLPEGADDVVKFDMMYHQNGTGGNIYAGRNPTAFSIEASVDGLFWEEVGGLTDIPITSISGYVWISKTAPYQNVSEVLSLASSVQAYGCVTLANVGPISVASGATLRFENVETPIAKLNLSGAGNGTIENVVFASSGTLTVDGIESGKTTRFAVTFENCSNLENLAKWNLSLGGQNTSRYHIQIGSDGFVNIVPRGLVVVLQ